MLTNIETRRPARIRFKDGQVVVCPEDQDVFLLIAENAIDACREAVRRDERMHHFKESLLRPLVNWAEQHPRRVESMYLAEANTEHLTAYVLTHTERYDFDLAEELAALDLSPGRAGRPISVHQVPRSDDTDLSHFFDPERALQIYG